VVTVGVEPVLLPQLRVGEDVDLTGIEAEAALEGRVVRIDRTLNPKTRLIDVDVQAPGVLVGAAYRAAIHVATLAGYLVPRDAVLSDAQGEHLFQVAGGRARRVSVRRVGGDDDTSVVEGALDPHLPIVVAGNYQLTDGAGVRLTEAAAPAK